MTDDVAPAAADEIPVQYVTAQVQVKPYAGLRTAATLCTLFSLLLNPLAVLSILGIVFSAMVLGRMRIAEAAGREVTTKGLMVVTLVVACGATLLFLYRFTTGLSAIGV